LKKRVPDVKKLAPAPPTGLYNPVALLKELCYECISEHKRNFSQSD